MDTIRFIVWIAAMLLAGWVIADIVFTLQQALIR